MKHNSNEQPSASPETDQRTDAEKFEDALRTIFATPKEVVQERMEAEQKQRKRTPVKKQPAK